MKKMKAHLQDKSANHLMLHREETLFVVNDKEKRGQRSLQVSIVDQLIEQGSRRGGIPRDSGGGLSRSSEEASVMEVERRA